MYIVALLEIAKLDYNDKLQLSKSKQKPQHK